MVQPAPEPSHAAPRAAERVRHAQVHLHNAPADAAALPGRVQLRQVRAVRGGVHPVRAAGAGGAAAAAHAVTLRHPRLAGRRLLRHGAGALLAAARRGTTRTSARATRRGDHAVRPDVDGGGGGEPRAAARRRRAAAALQVRHQAARRAREQVPHRPGRARAQGEGEGRHGGGGGAGRPGGAGGGGGGGTGRAQGAARARVGRRPPRQAHARAAHIHRAVDGAHLHGGGLPVLRHREPVERDQLLGEHEGAVGERGEARLRPRRREEVGAAPLGLDLRHPRRR